MKNLILIATLCMLSTSAIAEDEFVLKQENRTPMAAYMPNGFDSNDNAELVFEGMFPNACYKVGMTYQEVDQTNMKIQITDTVYHYEGVACARVIVPYVKEVDFGALRVGDYEILFKNTKDEFISYGYLNVKASTSGQVDDHLYAPIEQATFQRAKDDKPATLTLEGHFTNSCMYFDKTELHHKTGSNTIEVLPIAKMLDNTDCYNLEKPNHFKKVVELKNMPEGRFLLHIRSLNGQAVNRIANL